MEVRPEARAEAWAEEAWRREGWRRGCRHGRRAGLGVDVCESVGVG